MYFEKGNLHKSNAFAKPIYEINPQTLGRMGYKPNPKLDDSLANASDDSILESR